MTRLATLVLLLLFFTEVFSQDVTVILPNVREDKFDLNDLQNIILQNHSSRSLTVQVDIKLLDRSQTEIFSARSNLIQLVPGVTTIPRIIDPLVLTPKQAQRFSAVGLLNPGRYIVEVVVRNTANQAIAGILTLEMSIMAAFPPMLVYPSNGQKIYTLTPVLQWLAPIPILDFLTYSIKLVEVKTSENVRKSLDFNIPLLEQGGLTGTQLLYNFNVHKLEWDKTYAWQIKAWYSGTLIGETDIWTFTPVLPDQKEEENPEVNDSYWIMGGADAMPSGYYTSSTSLKFTWHNITKQNTLEYKIVQLSLPYDTLTNLPAIPVKAGINYIEIPKEDLQLPVDAPYLLIVKGEKGKDFKMRFKFIK